MKILFVCPGKTDAAWLKEGIVEYQSRLKHYFPFEYFEVPIKKGLQKEEALKAETSEVIKVLKSNDFIVLLDNKGAPFSSESFADFINKKATENVSRLVFIIGGAYGFSNEVHEKANHKLSLSKMTFTHQMVRVIFLEQLYRAMTIIKGEKYHH